MPLQDSEVIRRVYATLDGATGLPSTIVYGAPDDVKPSTDRPRVEISTLGIEPDTLTQDGRSRRRWVIQGIVVVAFDEGEFALRDFADTFAQVFDVGTRYTGLESDGSTETDEEFWLRAPGQVGAVLREGAEWRAVVSLRFESLAAR